MAYIYALVDPTTNEIRYIGKTKYDIDVRKSGHLEEVKSGAKTHKCNWIRKLLSSGIMIESKLLEEVSENEANEAEKKWISYGKEQGWKLTNSTIGGDGVIGYTFTEEQKKHISSSIIGELNGFYGKRHSEETRIKMRNAKLGKPRTIQSRSKQANTLKGRKLSKEWSENISKGKIGHKHSEDAKKKMSEAQKLRFKTTTPYSRRKKENNS